MRMVTEFIKRNFKDCVRVNNMDNESLIGLPYSYTVPCISDAFQEMYYWDTYFANIGLLLTGDTNQAKNNVENMAYLIRKYGFMPNGNRTYYLGRSQPPFFSEMVLDVYRFTKDTNWLRNIYDAIKMEYDFWTKERMTPIGLVQYAPLLKQEDEERLYNDFMSRVNADVDGYEKADIAKTTLIGCESGWDFTPRWGIKASDFVQIDLNSLILNMLKNLEFICTVLEDKEKGHYGLCAEKQAELMRKYMKSSDGLFMDYDFRHERIGEIFSAASFYPLTFQLATQEEAKAAVNNLYRLEQAYGVTACENVPVKGEYQWHYPNGWPPLQYMVIKGLINYGYISDAKRLAQKYIHLVDKNFEITNNIWEKYNVVDGSLNVTNEYDMPAMMGWTAGVYLFCTLEVMKSLE